MKCHIQLNQGWMKNFQNQDNTDGKHTFVLDVNDKQIKSLKIGELGQIEDFYVPDVENFYNDKFEERFGRLTKNLRDNIKPTLDKYIITNEDKKFIQSFIAINVSRSPKTNILAELTSNSPIKMIIPGVLSLAVYDTNTIYFEGYKIRFIYNNTDTDFVLPSYCHYRVPINNTNKNFAIIPINNKIAIVFDNNECEEYSITTISDNSIIDEYNRFALIVEIATNCDYLISKTEKPLLSLLDKITNCS